jgi:K+-transporting ATPase KdpF subunit
MLATSKELPMNWVHMLAALLTLGLLVYLAFALLCPERFQ